MRAELLHLHLDESGGFEAAQRNEPMVMAILGRWGEHPPERYAQGMWETAWAAARPGPAPDLSNFHGTEYANPRTLDKAGRALASTWPGAFALVFCRWRKEVGPPPDYVEMLLAAAVRAIDACVAAQVASGAAISSVTVRIEAAYRRGVNMVPLESRIARGAGAALKARGVHVSVTVCLWLTDVNRSVFLVYSDALGIVVRRAIEAGEPLPCGDAIELSQTDSTWRLPATDLAFLRGDGSATGAAPKVAPAVPPPAAAAASPPAAPVITPAPSPPSGRPALATLYRELLADHAPDAASWIARHVSDPSALDAEERAAIVRDILLLGEQLVEQRREWEPARRARALALDLCLHPAWREGWTEQDDDRADVRIATVGLVLANHAGEVGFDEDDFAADRARAARLLAAECDTEAVLVHHNRVSVGLTNAFRFAAAHAHLAPVLDWLQVRAAQSPFASRSVQLGQYLGTAGQVLSLRAHAAGDAAGLDAAERCFEGALRQDDDPAHQLRQETYLLHLYAERLRLGAPGWDARRALAAADRFAVSSKGALDRLRADPTGRARIGDAFRVHALAKLACVAGGPFPDAGWFAERYAEDLPETHPWPLMAAWLLRLAGARPSWRLNPADARLRRALARRADAPDLVAFVTRVVLLAAGPADAVAIAALDAHVPASVRPGWDESGYAARLASWPAGRSIADLLPFNFC